MSSVSRFDAVSDHYRYARHLTDMEQEDRAVESEMYDLKHDALERISKIVHPEYERKFIDVLIYGVKEGLQSAESLAKDLGLHQGHLLSLEGNFMEMREYLRDARRYNKSAAYAGYEDDGM